MVYFFVILIYLGININVLLYWNIIIYIYIYKLINYKLYYY